MRRVDPQSLGLVRCRTLLAEALTRIQAENAGGYDW